MPLVDAMAKSLVNFSKVSKIADLYATSRCSAYDWNYDQVYIINQNVVAMTTSLENLSKIF